jgi:hypothetical protein
MKKVLLIPTLALVALVAFPQPSHALSCMDPEMMVKQYVENPEYIIVTASPIQNKEHVKQHANKMDPNAAYNEGYTAQLLEVETAHKGSLPDTLFAYFQRNGTWNYLCVGEPPKIGTDNLYVLQQSNDLFGITSVSAVYPADSKLAKEILTALEKSDEDFGEPSVYEVDKAYWLEQISDQLGDMVFMIKVKLAEWNFWKTTK